MDISKMENTSDLISRKAAIDTIMSQPPEPHYPSWYAEQIKALPPVQRDFDLAEKIDKAYDDGYEAGYMQAKHDWGNLDE
jgi:hypothetical protein